MGYKCQVCGLVIGKEGLCPQCLFFLEEGRAVAALRPKTDDGKCTITLESKAVSIRFGEHSPVFAGETLNGAFNRIDGGAAG